MPRKQHWQDIADTINLGGNLSVASEGYPVAISSLECNGLMVCMIESEGMSFAAIMDRLEELAKRFQDEGIVTDEVNGSEYGIG